MTTMNILFSKNMKGYNLNFYVYDQISVHFPIGLENELHMHITCIHNNFSMRPLRCNKEECLYIYFYIHTHPTVYRAEYRR